MTFKLMPVEEGIRVYVGGCVGTITDTNDEITTVEGVYHYNDDLKDFWSFIYKTAELQKVKTVFSCIDEITCWDISDIHHIYGYDEYSPELTDAELASMKTALEVMSADLYKSLTSH